MARPVFWTTQLDTELCRFVAMGFDDRYIAEQMRRHKSSLTSKSIRDRRHVLRVGLRRIGGCCGGGRFIRADEKRVV